MVYNPQNTKEVGLPADTIVEGEIKNIKPGKVKEFVKAEAQKNWQGDLDGDAIDMTIEITHQGRASLTKQMFTYTDNNGVTEYNPKSNMGKYKKKYGKMPEVGDKIKLMTNAEGFAKIKLD